MAMHILQNGAFFEVTFDYDRSIVAAIKRIPGKKWIPAKKTWLVPIAQEAKLMNFYKKYSVRNQVGAMQTGPIPELPYLKLDIPLTRPLFPFQERGVAFCLQKRTALICDKMGLGKTTQAIATIHGALQYPCLVACPKTLRQTWRAEWMTVAGKRAVILDDRNITNWWKYYTTGVADVFILNYDSLEKFFVASIETPPGERMVAGHIKLKEQARLFKSYIVDESHRCKEYSTRRAQVMMSLTAGSEWVLALTGTPIVNKTIDIMAQLCIINRIHEFGGIKAFKERYCNNDTYLPELQYKLRTTCMYQRRKEEVLTELPAKIRQKILVDITNREEYDAAIKNLSGYLKQYQNRSDDQVRKSMAGEIMVRIQVCKNIAARGKLEAVFEQIQQLIEAGEKVVAFVHQKVVAQRLMAQFPGFVTVRGDDTEDQRNAAMKAFQTDARTVGIICSIKAGSVGITLTAARYVMLVEIPWHAADCEQCEDRTHRIGQAFQVYGMYFIGHKTIDEQIYQLIEEKRNLADNITGGQDATQEEIIDRISNSLFSGMTF